MPKLLVVCALRDEFPRPGKYRDNLIFTGVGKVNAAIHTTQAIIEYQPDLVVNVGTCGSNRSDLSGLLEFGIFHNKDDNFNNEIIVFDSLKYTIKTSDSFQYNIGEADAVDMESFAIAKTCKVYNVKFRCFKYISDYLGSNSIEEWSENVAYGNDYYLDVLDSL